MNRGCRGQSPLLVFFGVLAMKEKEAQSPPALARPGPVVLDRHYRFLAWLLPTVEKFPRSVKFSLGDRVTG